MEGDALREVLTLSNSIRRILSSINKEYGISGSQIRCLHVIQRAEIDGGHINQKELEVIFNIQKSSMSELLRSMEEKNLIVRIPSKTDNRIKNVSLTEKRKRLSYLSYNDLANLERQCTTLITNDELEITKSTLNKMKLILEEGGKENND